MTMTELLDQWRHIHHAWARGTEPAGPAADADLAALEQVFRSKGAATLPAEAFELWSQMDGLGIGLISIWAVRSRETANGLQDGVIDSNSELTRELEEHVYVGTIGGEYLGYHVPTGRVDLVDVAGTPRDGFPDLCSVLQVMVSMEGG
ncbi:MAG: hypothetical protein Q4G67_10850 [Actinomycetia bacterium]|nr:hypothetical protein [Actinomycetes bacterium]